MGQAQNALLYLINQGYQPPQAAALVGNMMQESSLNPSAVNESEGAFGLMQWRLDRRKALEDFAAKQEEEDKREFAIMHTAIADSGYRPTIGGTDKPRSSMQVVQGRA